MKRLTQLLCLLLVAAFLVGCGPQPQPESPTNNTPETSGVSVDSEATEPQETQPQSAVLTEQKIAELSALGESPDDNYRVFYEIFVYSFCDSNGDGIGDIQGVISKLDYLQELGINGIWFMPIHPSQSYHKYDVRDYYEIDPDYGTMADMEQLLAECAERDIHVITDLVLNHTGNDHEWFVTACEYLKSLPAGAEPNAEECPYVDYYFFSREQKNAYCPIEGSDWYYEGKFSPHMPDLNLANPVVRQEIQDIMQFWFDKGVSGFRLDAAKEFYSGDANANVEVLNWIQETATSIKEDAYLVAEVWEGFASITHYYTSGITSLFNFPFGTTDGKVPAVARAAGTASTVASFAKALEQADTAYLESNPNYIDAPFASNHDVGRLAGFVGRDELKMKIAGAMNVLMGGSCFIYYGEEIGMVGSGNDPSKRAPMYWNAERNNGVTDPPPECELPESYPLASAEEQRVDDTSLYNYYRQVIALRKAMPVISHGRVTEEAALNVNCVSAQRKTWGEEQCIILMNIQNADGTADLTDYADWTVTAFISADGNDYTLDGTTLTLPPFGVAVLTPVA